MGSSRVDTVREVEEEGREAPLGDHVPLKQRREGGVAEGLGEACAEGLAGANQENRWCQQRSVDSIGLIHSPEVVTQAEVAPDDVLEKPDRLALDQLVDHVAKHSADRVEALVRLADVSQPHLVEQDLLDDEDGDRLAQLGPGLHDAKAKGDDLGREEEVDHVRVVILLDERTDHAERGEAEVLEWARLAGRVEERVEEERDVGREEEGARVVVRGDALQECERIADPVRGMGGERRR